MKRSTPDIEKSALAIFSLIKYWNWLTPLLGLAALVSINFYGLISLLPKELRGLIDSGFLWPHVFELSISLAVAIAFSRFVVLNGLFFLVGYGRPLRVIIRKKKMSEKFRFLRWFLVVVLWQWEKFEITILAISSVVVFTIIYFDTYSAILFFGWIVVGWVILAPVVLLSSRRLTRVVFTGNLSGAKMSHLLKPTLLFLVLYLSFVAYSAGQARMLMNFRRLVYFEGAGLKRQPGHFLGSSSNGMFFSEVLEIPRFSLSGRVSIHFISFDGGSSLSVLHDFDA